MAAKTSALSRVAQFLEGIGIKAPWKYTGPVSTPEYLTHIHKANAFRKFAPASPPIRAVIPQAELDRVYDIKYYARDMRRAHLPGGKIHMEHTLLDPKAKIEALEAMELPPTPGASRLPKYRSILDQDNNGYTL